MAIPLGWKEVTLQNHNVSLVQSHLNNFDGDQYFKNGYLIKKLTFQGTVDYRDSCKFNRLELLELLNHLPNLNEIDLDEADYPDEYLKFLLDADLQYINKIDIGSNLFFTRSSLLFSVYNTFRSSITSIRLLYNRNLINYNSRQTNTTLNSLTQFRKLTKLELHNTVDTNLAPFQIQDSCPKLKHLEFFSDHPISESAVRYVLNDNRRIDLNFISSLPSLSATYTRYLVDYFSNQLNDLNIVISRQNIFKWIDIIGMELATSFMKKAGGIDKTCLGFVLREKNPIQTGNENNMTKYFMLLNSFRGTRQTHCTAKFNDPVRKIKDFGYSFIYDIFGNLFVTYNIYEGDLHGSDTVDKMAVPDKTSSIIGLEIFHFLEFNLSSQNNGDVYRVLNYSLSNCHGLRSLKITCYWNGLVYSSLCFRHLGRKVSSDQANGDINFLNVKNITAECLDLVTAHLHNIETISLKAKDWSRKYNNPVIDLTYLS
ncbi:hypothetical protein MFLAVUS_007351 [Mucor flavus]|uniref:Uncharacterized protein n=1 Tax=Mucor flavus TaxID=439312 RepID=A0ABP9Z421_9FUNG